MWHTENLSEFHLYSYTEDLFHNSRNHRCAIKRDEIHLEFKTQSRHPFLLSLISPLENLFGGHTSTLQLGKAMQQVTEPRDTPASNVKVNLSKLYISCAEAVC
jgi:hypothetical protein